MGLSISCSSTPKVRIVVKTEVLTPDPSFYAEPIESGLHWGMTLGEIITSITTALGQANDDRSQIKEWAGEHFSP